MAGADRLPANFRAHQLKLVCEKYYSTDADIYVQATELVFYLLFVYSTSLQKDVSAGPK